jgi:protein Mpv17
MLSFGLLLYGVNLKPTNTSHRCTAWHLPPEWRKTITGVLAGPFQHYWYRALANWFPGSGLRSFGIKVTLNQVVLGPLVLCTAFSWNLVLQQQADQVVGKIKKDMFPTLVNGWKFWVPAACINFFLVPVNYQVLWMSLCGVLWTGYISFASYNSANAISVEK